MPGFLWRTAVLCWVLAGSSKAARAVTNYFLVAERPANIVYDDSYVIVLTNSAHIAHAQDLIARGPDKAHAPLVVADIAAGADGLNRDLGRADARPWSWHVTSVNGFADATIEILDGSPGYVESDVPGWIQNTGGQIGFWTYTIVAELPLTPRIDAVELQGNQIKLSLTNLTPPFAAVVEVATNLPAAFWLTQTNVVPATLSTNVLVPPTTTQGFYRIRTP